MSPTTLLINEFSIHARNGALLGRDFFLSPITQRRRKMAHPVPTKAFLQPSPDTVLLFSPFGSTDPPLPDPPLLLMQNPSPKDTAKSTVQVQVAWHTHTHIYIYICMHCKHFKCLGLCHTRSPLPPTSPLLPTSVGKTLHHTRISTATYVSGLRPYITLGSPLLPTSVGYDLTSH